MWHDVCPGGEFFAAMLALDLEITKAVAAEGCHHCGGALHRSDYQRKPRGGLLAAAGEAFCVRFSLCCGCEGCRRRSTPPSLRFMGRRVYLEVVVLLASAFLDESQSGVPRRTVRRWRGWWSTAAPQAPTWIEARARFVPPPPDDRALPASLLDRLAQDVAALPEVILERAARLVAPMTTRTCPESSRFVLLG